MTRYVKKREPCGDCGKSHQNANGRERCRVNVAHARAVEAEGADQKGCDGGKCFEPWNRRARRMELGGGAGVFLCRVCWGHELNYRRERNEELEPFAQYELPPWPVKKADAARGKA